LGLPVGAPVMGAQISTISRSQTATGSSSSSVDQFAPTRFPDGYRVELIERG